VVAHRDFDENNVASTQYLVKWKGLPYADCTWENPDGKIFCKNLIFQTFKNFNPKLMHIWIEIKPFWHIQAVEILVKDLTLPSWKNNQGTTFSNFNNF
jgi:hypothetical protein